MIRRRFLSLGTAAAAGAVAAPAILHPAHAQGARATIVLVHGAWHGAWCWSSIVDRLAAAGVQTLALDLPGHGVGAAFPEGYFDQPQDPARLATAPSPLAALDAEAYRVHVTRAIEGLVRGGSGPVVLVGHSLGGVTLNRVGEASPELVRRLVYLAALMPVAKPVAGAYFADPAMATSLALPLFIGDPSRTGAVRFNHRSTDPAFRSAAKAAFYADVSDTAFAAVANLLTPDEPAAVFGAEVRVTAGRWGRVPRTYIRCSEDQAIPIAAQDAFIAEGDTLVPANRTQTRTLQTSHSPFLSAPDDLTALLLEAAA